MSCRRCYHIKGRPGCSVCRPQSPRADGTVYTAALLLLALLLAGCAGGAQTVATDVQVVEKPVPIACRIDWPPSPTPYVAMVQLSGNQNADLVLIWRAAEAELEALLAYRGELDAAAKACIEPK